jgi:hypothetical protein
MPSIPRDNRRIPRGTRRPAVRTLLVTIVLLLGAVIATPGAAFSHTPAIAPSQNEKPPPTLWRACPVNGREEAKDRVVRSFERGPGVSTTGPVMPAGSTDLICGDDRHSYYHIAARHGADWTRKGVKSSENWRDVADYSIAEALRNPMSVTYSANANTYCYSREVQLVHKVRGITVDVMHPNVVVRAQDGVVITAFPTSKPC